MRTFVGEMAKRVACIGDSLTWGFTLRDPWRESYPALLQEMLGTDFTVRNFGCNGASVRADSYSPYTDTAAFRSSLAWMPDIVLLMLGSNDCVPQEWDPGAFRRDYERIVGSYCGLSARPYTADRECLSQPHIADRVFPSSQPHITDREFSSSQSCLTDRDFPSRPRLILIAPIRMFRVMGYTFMDLSPETLENGVRPAIRAIAADNDLEFVDLRDVISDSRYCCDGVHPQAEGTRLVAEAIYAKVAW
ncbi:MAG: hypothetical protein J6P46_00330 [Bacteroidales bacterium]|nr:hypothetical protein [Bacteroidales bacterium]